MSEPGPKGWAGSVSVLATQCGGLAWVSGALFEIEGRWSAVAADPGLVRHLATHSRYHGWHAQLWVEILPDSAAFDADTLVVAPRGWPTAEVDTDLDRLGLLCGELLPRASALLSEVEQAAQRPGAAEVARVARLVRADLRTDLEGATALRYRLDPSR